ncbi:MAG: tetratricopeptide repeat protein, partial [Magnetococcales bacterium]|nr:tetratricopeptide repeat protein [Magnetococcales bacterium]
MNHPSTRHPNTGKPGLSKGLLTILSMGLALGSLASPMATEPAAQLPTVRQEPAASPSGNPTVLMAPPFLPLPPPPPAARNDPKAAEAATLGKKALQEQRTTEAANHFVQAHALDPGQADWLHNAATLSLQAGQTEQALEHLRRASALAASRHAPKDAAAYNSEISRLVNALPSWVDEALNQAGAVPANKAGAAGMWSKSREESMAAAEKGELDKAIRLGRQAVNLARENLGPTHSATFMSERELGTCLTMAGKGGDAEPLLLQAAASASKALGSGHPETLAARKALAELAESRQNPAAAREIYETARKGWREKVGAAHPMAIDNDLALARVLKELGEPDQAESLYREVCARSAGVHG